MRYQDYRRSLENNEKFLKAREELSLKFALGNAVIGGRISKGWSQTRLAKEVGTRQANISRIESGLANPTIELVSKIIKVLDITINFDHVVVTSKDDVLYRSLFAMRTPVVVSNIEVASSPTQRTEGIPIDLSKTVSTLSQ